MGEYQSSKKDKLLMRVTLTHLWLGRQVFVVFQEPVLFLFFICEIARLYLQAQSPEDCDSKLPSS